MQLYLFDAAWSRNFEHDCLLTVLCLCSACMWEHNNNDDNLYGAITGPYRYKGLSMPLVTLLVV